MTCPHEWSPCPSRGWNRNVIAPVRLVRRSQTKRTGAARLRGPGGRYPSELGGRKVLYAFRQLTAKHLRLEERAEDFAVQQLVT